MAWWGRGKAIVPWVGEVSRCRAFVQTPSLGYNRPGPATNDKGATKVILPCKHEERVTQQVRPTIDLLTDMDVLHPDVLLQHAIQPADYKSGLVFRSAIESIRGTFIASSTTGREGLVRDVLENLLQRNCVADYAQSGSRARHDFTVSIERDPDYFAALEVKGGEGNSINISERPLWAREFGVWSFLIT